MKIHGNQPQPQRPDDGRVDGPGSALPSTAGAAASSSRSERGDRLELSDAGRLMQPERAAGASSERMEQLKQALAEGTLNSRERIELAARTILGANEA